MNKALTYKKFFVIAGVLAIVNTLLTTISQIVEHIFDRFILHDSFDLSWYIFPLLSCIAGLFVLTSFVLLLIKKDCSIPFVVTRCIALIFTVIIVILNMVSQIRYIIDLYIYDVFDRLPLFLIQRILLLFTIPLTVISLILLLLLCVLYLVYKNKRCKLLSLWIIPVIIQAFGWLINVIRFLICYIPDIVYIFTDFRITTVLYATTWLFSIVIISPIGIASTFLLCFALNKANKQKAKLAEEEAISDKEIENTENPMTSSEKPVVTDKKSVTPAKKPQTVKKNSSYSTDLHPCDEIVKYKKLLDEGIITKEEFDTKKKQILDL